MPLAPRPPMMCIDVEWGQEAKQSEQQEYGNYDVSTSREALQSADGRQRLRTTGPRPYVKLFSFRH